ncbi:hypothetical protein I3V78_38555 [Archangium primigenium]|nr:hypothetical protein [Archangium primigenium]
MVCEAPADQKAACGLADRVLLEEVDWITHKNLEDYRKWRGATMGADFLGWGSVGKEFQTAGLKGVFGRFDGRPGAPDAHAARRALLLMAASARCPDAVVLMRDSDAEPERRIGLEQARDEWKGPFPVIIGLAEAKRECWVLNGFDPRNKEEEKRLDGERQRLSLHPVLEAHLLDPSTRGSKKDVKRVLEALIPKDEDPKRVRECACLEETPLATLSARGVDTGLTAYIQEVRDRLVPIFKGNPGPASGRHGS